MAMPIEKSPREFVLPQTIAEANERRDVVWSEINKLELQLADPNKIDPTTGRRMSRRYYQSWRFRMVRILGELRAEHRNLQQWIQAKRSDTNKIFQEVETLALKVIAELGTSDTTAHAELVKLARTLLTLLTEAKDIKSIR